MGAIGSAVLWGAVYPGEGVACGDRPADFRPLGLRVDYAVEEIRSRLRHGGFEGAVPSDFLWDGLRGRHAKAAQFVAQGGDGSGDNLTLREPGAGQRYPVWPRFQPSAGR